MCLCSVADPFNGNSGLKDISVEILKIMRSNPPSPYKNMRVFLFICVFLFLACSYL